MIQKNNLRIGNWVMFCPSGQKRKVKERPVQVISIGEKEVLTKDKGVELSLFYDSSSVRPIEITEENLRRCGLTMSYGTAANSSAIYSNFAGYRIYLGDGFNSIHFDADNWFPKIREIQTINDFQNWFYFTVGRELEFVW